MVHALAHRVFLGQKKFEQTKPSRIAQSAKRLGHHADAFVAGRQERWVGHADLRSTYIRISGCYLGTDIFG
jgi:hypothetical protein